MKISKEQLKTIILEELNEMEDLDEGWLDRMKAHFKGGVEAGKTVAGNLKKAAWEGEPGEHAGKAMTAGKSSARLDSAAKKFEKMGKDVYNDIKILLKDTIDSDPDMAKEVTALRSALKAAVTRINSIKSKLESGIKGGGGPTPTP